VTAPDPAPPPVSRRCRRCTSRRWRRSRSRRCCTNSIITGSARPIEGVEYADAEVDFFDDVVKGVHARSAELDALIAGKLAKDWSLARLDKPMRQILRAGAYELVARIDVPTGSVISEYLDVAKAFYDKREASFVNGLLDAIAKEVRG
jgi:N utilization substance protein B